MKDSIKVRHSWPPTPHRLVSLRQQWPSPCLHLKSNSWRLTCRSKPPPPQLQLCLLQLQVPEHYSGEPEGCNQFLNNCSIALQSHTFASETAKVAFAINHLTGRARLCGTAEWERGTAACSSFQAFSTELRKVFGLVSLDPDATGGLMSQRQAGQPTHS